jgi:hypothetical protein
VISPEKTSIGSLAKANFFLSGVGNRICATDIPEDWVKESLVGNRPLSAFAVLWMYQGEDM